MCKKLLTKVGQLSEQMEKLSDISVQTAAGSTKDIVLTEVRSTLKQLVKGEVNEAAKEIVKSFIQTELEVATKQAMKEVQATVHNTTKVELNKEMEAATKTFAEVVNEGTKAAVNTLKADEEWNLVTRKGVKKVMMNMQKEDERKNNLVIFHLPEKEGTVANQKDHDIKDFIDISKICQGEISPNEIEEVRRLGKPDKKDRPLLVKLRDEMKKKLLFRNLRLWREHQHQERGPDNKTPFIEVAHDMTQDQRKERKEKLEEARKMTSDLGPASPHRYLVRGPPWAMYLVRVLKAH